MNRENIWFLIQLTQQKQQEVDEILNINHHASFVNKNLLENVKAHKQSCDDALAFLKTLAVEEV